MPVREMRCGKFYRRSMAHRPARNGKTYRGGVETKGLVSY